MEHEQANELFSSYWDGELSGDRKAALEEHLAACAECRRDWETFQRALRSLAAMERTPAPPDFAAGVVDRVRRRSGGRFFGGRPAGRLPVEVISALMLLIILAVYIVLQFSEPSNFYLP